MTPTGEMMNLTAEYYGMVGAAQFHGIMMALAVTMALALIIGAIKLVVKRVRGRNDS